jgi:hypothetical protein
VFGAGSIIWRRFLQLVTPVLNPSQLPAMNFNCAAADVTLYNIYDTTPEGLMCPVYSSFFGVMGASAAMVFSGM